MDLKKEDFVKAKPIVEAQLKDAAMAMFIQESLVKALNEKIAEFPEEAKKE